MNEAKNEQVPGMEKYAYFPHVADKYRANFYLARRVFSCPWIPENIRNQSERLAIDFAAHEVEKLLVKERQTQKMATEILEVGNAIIAEKCWPNIPNGENFAWQLNGDSRNAQSLRMAARTGKTLIQAQRQLKTKRHGYDIVAEFKDVSDLMIGTSPERSMAELMSEFFGELVSRLGFLEAGEDLKGCERVTRKSILKVRHPQSPFIASLFTFSSRPLKPADECQDPETVRALRAILGISDTVRDPSSIIRILPYHAENVRHKK